MQSQSLISEDADVDQENDSNDEGKDEDADSDGDTSQQSQKEKSLFICLHTLDFYLQILHPVHHCLLHCKYF